nr:GGDEF domain-containing protein [Lysobacter sp. CAU 1642]
MQSHGPGRGAAAEQVEEEIALALEDPATGVAGATLCIRSEQAELLRLRREVRQLGLNDPVTGLPNRRLLFERIGQAQQRSKRSGHFGAIVVVDLERFRVVNDRHGHETGDRLLHEVGQRIAGTVRATDTVARLAADEFVVLAEGVGLDQSQGIDFTAQLRQRIDEALSAPCELGPLSLRLTARVGNLLFRGEEPSASDLLTAAAEIASRSDPSAP